MGFWDEFKKAKKQVEEELKKQKEELVNKVDVVKKDIRSSFDGNNTNTRSNVAVEKKEAELGNTNNGGFSARLENLIQLALQDGVLTDKEREIILRRAENEGEDVDEVEMILEARLAEMKVERPVEAEKLDVPKSLAAEKSQKDYSPQVQSSAPLSVEIDEDTFVLPKKPVIKRGEYTENGKKKILVPSVVEEIAAIAFCDRSKLESVIFEENSNLTEIGSGAFSGCSKLNSITLPASVEKIGSSAFSGCSKLKSITIPASVEKIGSSAFSGCSKLKSITIPASVEEIGDTAFLNCSKLESVIFEENSNLAEIGLAAFSGCSKLKSITIPASVEKIGGSAFGDCNVYISDEDKGILKLVKVGLSDEEKDCMIVSHGVTDIERDVLRECKKIFLPSSVQRVGKHGIMSGTNMYVYSPELQSLDINSFSSRCLNLYVLPQDFDSYVAQREAEGIPESKLSIHPMPDEYLYMYDND